MYGKSNINLHPVSHDKHKTFCHPTLFFRMENPAHEQQKIQREKLLQLIYIKKYDASIIVFDIASFNSLQK
jgi:hypothetical protein